MLTLLGKIFSDSEMDECTFTVKKDVQGTFGVWLFSSSSFRGISDSAYGLTPAQIGEWLLKQRSNQVT